MGIYSEKWFMITTILSQKNSKTDFRNYDMIIVIIVISREMSITRVIIQINMIIPLINVIKKDERK